MPKLNFCIKRTLVELDSFAKTGEDIKMEETVIEPCLLDCVGHAACGVDIGAARDANSEFIQMVHLFQSSIWRFLLLIFFPEFMTLFGIQVFYPKAANYLDRLLRQLLDSHAKARKYDDMLGVHLRPLKKSRQSSGIGQMFRKAAPIFPSSQTSPTPISWR